MRNFFGIIIVLFGVGLLLQQLNIPGADKIMSSWWPIAIIIVGMIAWGANPRQWFGPLMIVLVGGILFVDNFGFFHESAWNLFWPIIIIIIGSRLVMGRSWNQHVKSDTGLADASAVFSGVDRKVTGPVVNSSISAWFGGVKLDLRDAEFPTAVTFNITAGFGGIEMIVPRDVKVVTRVTALFGGAEDKTSPSGSPIKTLTISGSAMFGGVSIKN